MEENECRRAHDMAVEKYTQVFNKDVSYDEVRDHHFVVNFLYIASIFPSWLL